MSRLSSILKRVVRFILDCIASLVCLFIPDQYGYLPPIRDKLLLQPAVVLVRKIRSGEIKSEDLIKAYINRIKEVEPHINALIDERFVDALAEAKAIDQQIKQALSNSETPNDDKSILSKPLLGIPFSGKDSHAIEGLRFTAAVPDRKDIRAECDSTNASMLRSAGAIPICMTNVPELLLWWDTTNKTFGRTYNPYNKSLIAGGSSGGNASLISSAGSIVGMGSDIGGSIRIPANFCGIYGHCCSIETVPLDHHWPPYTEGRKKLVSYGPITRYACDLRPMVKVYTGKCQSQLKLDEPVDLKQLKIYYVLDFNDPSLTPVCDDVKQAILKAVTHFRSIGAVVEEAKFNNIDDAFEVWMCKMQSPDANKMSFEMTNRTKHLNIIIEIFKCLVGMSPHTLAALVTAFTQEIVNPVIYKDKKPFTDKHMELKKEMDNYLDDRSVLILPTHPELKIRPFECFLKFKNTCYTGVFNTLQVAMTQIPMGLNKCGLPIGIQAIAGHLNDHLTITIAEQLDKEFGGWVPPTKIVEA